MGDAVSHAVLPGIVIAYVVGIPLAIGAFAAGMTCALATGYLKENSRIFRVDGPRRRQGLGFARGLPLLIKGGERLQRPLPAALADLAYSIRLAMAGPLPI